jgi:hypothetical protein
MFFKRLMKGMTMPTWFVTLAIAAMIGLICCNNTAFVASSIMFTNGLMIPVWILAVNLWWITLALAPLAWFARRGYPVRGFLTSACVVLALFTLPSFYIALQRQALVPTPVNTANLTPLPASEIGSLEIVLTDDIAYLHACQVLCQQLLTGGDLQWIRMASAPDAKLPQRAIVYYRAASEDCAALDHNFPTGEECLLARADDGSPADIQMHLTELGDFNAPMTQNAGFVALTGVQKLDITDLRDGRQLIAQSRYGWIEPMVGFLEPDTDFDVAVRAHGGFRLHPKRLYVGKIDLRASLNSIGIRTGPPRSTQPYYSPAELVWSFGGYLTQLPYDEPLNTTMFDVANGKPVSNGTAAEMFLTRLPGLVATAPVVVVAPASSEENVSGGQIQPDAKQNLPVLSRPAQTGHPDDDDLGGWLAQISASDGFDALHALSIVKDMISDAPPGTYDAFGDAYLVAREKTPGLTPYLGNFAFDPTPHLRDLWTAGVDEAADALVLQAICRADARWSHSLSFFVVEAGESLLPHYRDPKFFGANLLEVVLILDHLQHADVARAFVNEIDWDIVDGLSPLAKFGTFPPVTRDLLLSRVDFPTPCHD